MEVRFDACALHLQTCTNYTVKLILIKIIISTNFVVFNCHFCNFRGL